MIFPRLALAVQGGAFTIFVVDFGVYEVHCTPHTIGFGWWLNFIATWWAQGYLFSIPGVAIFAMMAALTTTLWYLDRRRIPPGHCRQCRYNLTGNVSGRCPECGGAVKGNSDAHT